MGFPDYYDNACIMGSDRFMKFSVAPESSRAIALALFTTECMKKQTVIDLRADINTSLLLLCLINAEVIRQVENLDYLHPS